MNKKRINIYFSDPKLYDYVKSIQKPRDSFSETIMKIIEEHKNEEKSL